MHTPEVYDPQILSAYFLEVSKRKWNSVYPNGGVK